MGTHRFRLPPPEVAAPPPDARKGYLVGPDRIPCRTLVEFRPGLLLCHRENAESGKLHIPWSVPGHGAPMLATATLAERNAPYDLLVELARGKLDSLRNQLADWRTHLGMVPAPDMLGRVRDAQTSFAKAATTQNQPEVCARHAAESLTAACDAGDLATEAYTNWLFRLRMGHSPKLPTHLACTLEGDPNSAPWANAVAESFNAARIAVPWREIAPAEGKYHWDAVDAQLAWCQSRNLSPSIGPLLDLRAGALPDWLWLFQNDTQTLTDVILDWIRHALGRYRGRVPTWRLIGRLGTPKALGLAEEEQIELAARILQVARNVDSSAQMIVDFDRPWAESLGSTQATHQLGPLHLGDYLARSELGLGGVGLELAPGYGPPGSHLRDLLEFSRLLDLFSLLNLPLHLTIAMPSATESDPAGVMVHAHQWPSPPDPALQRRWGSRWVALALAKPFVKSVTWATLRDGPTALYPHSGLFTSEAQPKPLLGWLRKVRADHLV